MYYEMLDQRNLKFPSLPRFYSGNRKRSRATFSPLPEQSLTCNPDHKPTLTPASEGPGRERDVRAGRKEGRKGRGTHGVEDRKREWGAKGSWLWRETSDLLLQIKDWDTKGLMPQVLRYHVIACHQLLLENLKSTPNATSLQGESIVISVSQVKEATSGRCPFSLGLLFSPLP